MQEHIHVPPAGQHRHEPAWNEPSRDAEGRGVADIAAEKLAASQRDDAS